MNQRRTFIISGMHCAGCAAAVERVIKKIDGVSDVYVNFASGRLSFSAAENAPDDSVVINAVKKAGFKASLPREDLSVPVEPPLTGAWLEFGGALFFSVLLLIVCFGGFPADYRVNAMVQMLLLVPIAIAGRGFFIRGIPALFRLSPNMDTLISCGFLAGVFYSIVTMFSMVGAHLYFDSSAMIITLIMLGKNLETTSRRNASSAIRKLMELTPPVAHLLVNDKEIDVPCMELVKGDIIRIKPGEKVPADGEVVSGSSFVNESMLTGEELPVSCTAGGKVCGGTMNIDGVLTVKVLSTGRESMIGQIVTLISEAQSSRPPVAVLADKVSGFFVWIILIIAGLTAVVWGLAAGGGEALHFSLSVLVVACPCALGLATPIALITGIGKGTAHGILIKNGSALEIAAKLKSIVFDKTGTLTSGIPVVQRVFTGSNIDRDEFMQICACVESLSGHPLAKAVVSAVKDLSAVKKSDMQVGRFKSIPGKGVCADVNGCVWYFGNAGLMKENCITVPELPDDFTGYTLIYGAKEGVFCGVIALGDSIRPEAETVIRNLHESGIRCYMLTGDNCAAAENVAVRLELDGFKAGLLPQDKVNALAQIRSENSAPVAVVGDGINDAPVLSAADLGIAIGSGSNIAMESADVVLVKTDLREVGHLIKLSKATLKIIRQNLFWAFFYNICGIPLAAGVMYFLCGAMLNPAFCAGAMACSSLTVVLNALRLKIMPLK